MSIFIEKNKKVEDLVKNLPIWAIYNPIRDFAIIRADDPAQYIIIYQYLLLCTPCKNVGHNLKASWPPIPLTGLEKERAHFNRYKRGSCCCFAASTRFS